MVYCQVCKKNIATVHYTEIDIDYQVKQESHMCESCAQKHDLSQAGQKPATISPFKVIESLIKPNLPEQLRAILETRCEQCGMTYPEFRSAGRLGCPHDYAVFKDGIENVLEQVQGGGGKHVGKIPRRAGTVIKLEAREASLQEELKEAIGAENYERAAEVRDSLAELESDLKKAKGEADDGV